MECHVNDIPFDAMNDLVSTELKFDESVKQISMAYGKVFAPVQPILKILQRRH